MKKKSKVIYELLQEYIIDNIGEVVTKVRNGTETKYKINKLEIITEYQATYCLEIERLLKVTFNGNFIINLQDYQIIGLRDVIEDMYYDQETNKTIKMIQKELE